MHYFFDLDNTVAQSRAKLSPEMKRELSSIGSVVVISGASQAQMEYQLDGLDCEIMSQNGNVNSVWKRFLTSKESAKILDHISWYANVLDDQLEGRGAQISYSFVGHHADYDKKKKYDPEGSKRRAILKEYPAPEGIEIRIGGTTCLDYLPEGLNKGYNIYKYISHKGWRRKSCIYIGDALFPGGNDETVIGTIATYPVNGPDDTLRFLQT